MVHKALKDCVVVVASKGNHDVKQMKAWLSEASGRLATKIDADVTHLVIDSVANKHGQIHQAVQEAYKLRGAGQNIEIVSFGWLNDSLQRKTRRKEKPYRVEDPVSQGLNNDPKSISGLLTQGYMKATETVVDNSMRKRQHDKLKRAEAEAKEHEEREQKALNDHLHKHRKMGFSEFAAVFKRGAQKAKSVILSDNHHIYQDSTNFHYDITLTKVDTKNNTNERYNLVIFESNTEPHTYALATIHSGTKIISTNNVIIAIGANFPTVFSAFKRVFEDMAGVSWDQRVKVAEERAEQEQLSRRAKKMGAHARASLGPPLGPQSIEDLRTAKYQYYPPSYGPRGEFPDGSHLKETGIFTKKAKARSAEDEEQSPPPDFRAEDLQKFHQAMQGEHEDRLDPLSEPFSFGLDTDFDALTWKGDGDLNGKGTGGAAEGGCGAAAVEQRDGVARAGDLEPGTGISGEDGRDIDHGLTQNIDFGGYEFTQNPAAFAGTQVEVENGQLDVGGSVLGKRKDSPVDESAAKRAKTGGEGAAEQEEYPFEFGEDYN